ncbi:hypothetical protein UU9_12498 [Rhodanobacter fulvus Jip2]|uniref:Uncharacterized protein n=1 Tax=Rhodanobacter fulvus Jip2 TaxID=1163408 RepID=I4VMX8_9GAMM|nr:hypothetical protein [Rhodanobacter fulvus]EIL88569.1 hypothetical protein UU9_12498 [Rhodanobacter fulvus Jip2]
MYILTQNDRTAVPRAYRIDGGLEIWLELVPGTKLAMEPSEVQLIIAELKREVAAVEAMARGVSA